MDQLAKKLDGTLPDDKRNGYEQVYYMLKTKQVLGGSSLKKLQTILDTTGTDGRLHDQYLHIGAGATFRTTGRGVQMQNLKRLNGEGDDMAELWLDDTEWDNGKLAANLRQVFTASDPAGFLIVGDFSAVESRGLAWQAGEEWKLNAYRMGHDVYKELAVRKFNKPIEQITKPERTFGKVGELSCGYGAGADAVRDFAAKMGVELSEVESAQLVKDWRDADPKTVDYWARLHQALLDVVTLGFPEFVHMPEGNVTISPVPAPESLRKQTGNQDLLSLRIKMHLSDGTRLLERVIHGTHIVGRNVHYWKPSERKTGELWTDTWMNPKTKRQQPFTVYGGKLAGLLTQSLCREVFFDSLHLVHLWCQDKENVRLVGQFHDEIVLDWVPGPVSFDDTVAMLQERMTSTILPRFPLAAEIKSAYRYTK
jgi:DNA polymerase